MERVREVGADQARLDEETVDVARRALAREMARAVRPERLRRRRRTWAGLGIGGLVAGTAVTAIVVDSVLAPPSTPSASAAEVLNAAADAADDPALAAGQYLAVSTTFQYVQHWDLAAGSPAADAAEADGSFLVDQPIVRYVPAEPDTADWIVDRQPDTVVASWGDPAVVDQWQALWGIPDEQVSGVRRYPGGVGHTGAQGAADDAYFIDGRDFYAGMPSDPEGIIHWWEERYADEEDDGGYAHFFIETVTDVGTFNLAPASVRSAMLGAFASVEGMKVVDVDGDATTLRFDRGTQERPSVLEFVLDTRRGYILSVTDWGSVTPGSVSGDGVPGWQSRTEASVAVVDSAP